MSMDSLWYENQCKALDVFLQLTPVFFTQLNSCDEVTRWEISTLFKKYFSIRKNSELESQLILCLDKAQNPLTYALFLESGAASLDKYVLNKLKKYFWRTYGIPGT